VDGAAGNVVDLLDDLELFVFDARTGDYVSHDFAALPSWLHRQDLEEMEERDRIAPFDRITRMMMKSPLLAGK
jgi:hypothetical protein